MSIWSRIIESIGGEEKIPSDSLRNGVSHDSSRYAFVDVEVGVRMEKYMM